LNGLDLPENADKQLILDNFKNGMSWMLMYVKEEKQQWIDKACNTIKRLLGGYVIQNFNFGDSYDTDRFIEDLIKELNKE
jgi:hypothetical protein